MLESLPVLHDPAFYAVAVPAVLLVGLSKSGFAAGFGSLATPVLALTVPAPQAAAIMLPLLLVMDATGLQQMWRDRDAAMLVPLAPVGVWTGVWLVRRVATTWFYRLAYVGMFCTGVKLLSDAFK